MAATISQRATKTLNYPSIKRKWGAKASLNKYNEETNPQGIIDLGRAENKLCEQLVLDRFSQDDMKSVVASDLYYPLYHGSESLRAAIADFLNRKLTAKQKLLPENMIVTSGVGCGLDLLAHAMGDPGDCVLSPAPYYTRIRTDIGERGQLKSISVHTDETASDGSVVFRLTLDKIVAAYEDALQKGEKVCGIILINPHNPTGEIYDAGLVRDILHFAAKEKLHVVLDEIYALSVFEGEFRSSVTHMEQLPDPSRTHFVWGFSKDLSLSGYRIGVIHSWNPELIASIKPLIYFCGCPSVIQKQLEILITDTEWLDTVYFPANHAAMLKGRNHVMSWLDKLQLPYTVPSAAFFLWADFSKFLSPVTAEAEMELYEKLFNAGVNIEPCANAFYGRTPGFFRILFTIPQELTDKAFERIRAVLVK